MSDGQKTITYQEEVNNLLNSDKFDDTQKIYFLTCAIGVVMEKVAKETNAKNMKSDVEARNSNVSIKLTLKEQENEILQNP